MHFFGIGYVFSAIIVPGENMNLETFGKPGGVKGLLRASRSRVSLFTFLLAFTFTYTSTCLSQTELGSEDDLTVLGANGTAEDPDVEIKGFTVFGSTQAGYAGAAAAPGNVVVNGALAVSSGAYFVGDSTFPAAAKIYINDGSAGQVLRKNPAGYLDWDSVSALGDDLGSHLATTTLNMAGFGIVNVASITVSSFIRASSLTVIAPDTFASSLWVSTSATTPHLYVSTNGGVGIGTAGPNYLLDIVGGDLNVGGSGVYRRGGTAGTSISCGGGQVLTGGVVMGGIMTGGTCSDNTLIGSDYCPSDSVLVGNVCVDKYEASVWSNAAGGTQYGASSDDYPCNDNGQNCASTNKIYARSETGRTPSANLTWFQASAACRNSGKRLLTSAEWTEAANGTPDPGATGTAPNCNVSGSGPTTTGAGTSCLSAAGAENMIGSLWEWVAEWGTAGAGASNAMATMVQVDGTGTGYNDDGQWNVGGNSYTNYAAPAGWIAGQVPAVVRGGGWGDGAAAGVFTFAADDAPSVWSGSIGFRCGRPLKSVILQSGISEVSQDLTPQLGGDLDVNSHKIVSAANGNIVIEPNGTGNVGVGTANPAAKLHVSGDVQVGDLTASTISASGHYTFAGITQPTAAPGRVYYDASAKKLRLSTGTLTTDWVDLSTGGASGAWSGFGGGGTQWVKIYNEDVTTNKTSITVPGLSGDSDVAYKIIARFVNTTGFNNNYLVKPNNDTNTGNYGFQMVYGSGVNAIAERFLTNGGLYLGYSYASAGDIGTSEATLLAKSGQGRVMQTNWSNATGNSIGYNYLVSSVWNNTASNITSLVIDGTVANAIGAGSHIEVWTQGNPSGPVQWITTGNDIYYSAGNVGIGTSGPLAKLDVQAAGSTPTDMAQIWRNSAGTVVSSVSATGVMMATKFIGDGSGLSGVTATNIPADISISTINSIATTPYGGVNITTNTFIQGSVGISNLAPQARMDMVGTGASDTDYLHIWRNSSGVIVASMTSTGKIFANLSAAGTSDNLGNHTATQDLIMGANQVTGAGALTMSSVTATGPLGVRAARLVFDPNLEISSYTSAVYGKGVYVSTVVFTPGLAITSYGEVHTVGVGRGSVTGAARGPGAVDLQVNRGITTQVASGGYSVVAGGQQNTAAGLYAVVPGGSQNTAGNQYSTVGGGVGNNASGDRAVVPGGDTNLAGGLASFAAGSYAKASAAGAFTWADSQGVAIDNVVANRTVFKNAGGFMVTGSTNTAMSGTVNRGILITGNGRVGISTGVPDAALDVVADGPAATDMAQLWRNSGGTIVSSVSATGVLKAAKFIGDGSGLSGVTATDIPASISVSTINALPATTYGGVNITTSIFVGGNVGIGTTTPKGLLHVGAGAMPGLLVTNAGYVGIGTTTPSMQLEVIGSANISSVIFAWQSVFGQNNNTASPLPGYISGANVGTGIDRPGADLIVQGGKGTGSGGGGALSLMTAPPGASGPGTNFTVERVRITNIGNVGIGTTTPTGLFQVGGGSLTVLSSGNVGIGTTAPSQKLDIKGGNGASLRLNSSDYGGGVFRIAGRDESLGGTGSSYNHAVDFKLTTHNSNAGNGAESNIMQFYKDGWSGGDIVAFPRGSVGIGTTGPGYKLDVNGDMNLAAGSVYRIGGVAQSGSSKWTAGTGDDIYRNLGNVGIGNTGPLAALDTSGVIRALSGNWIAATGGKGVETYFLSGADAGYINAYDRTAGVLKNLNFNNGAITVAGTGNVGIGTTNPGSKLHAVETSGANSYIFVASTATDSGSYKMVVSTTGNVGIGTTSPAEQLSLTGNLSLPATSGTGGTVKLGGSRFLHAYGTNNAFVGAGTGNTTLSGSENVFVGSAGGGGLTSGNWNASLGAYALPGVSSGGGNTAVGRTALNQVTTTSNNTAVGFQSLNNTIGSGNTALGGNAGSTDYNGTNNTFLGYNAGATGAGGLTNATAIGYNASVNQSNSLVLGNAANVGIGTTGPQARLHVISTSTTDSAIFIASHSIGGYALFASTNGNVGIGTTGPTHKLEVNGNIGTPGGSGNGIYLPGNSTAIWQIFNNQAEPHAGTNGLAFYKAGAEGSASGTKMVINTDGNVGIGTTSPVSKVHIVGGQDAPSITAQSGLFRISAAGITGLNIGIANSSPYGSWLQATNEPASGGSAFPLLLNPLGGSVGIGTSAPAYKLDVAGTMNAQEVRVNGVVLNPGTGSNWTVSGADVYRNGGKVGIGTTSPGYKLTVAASTANDGLFVTNSNRQSTTFQSTGEHSIVNIDSAHSNLLLPFLNFQRLGVTYGTIQLARAATIDGLGSYTESEMSMGSDTATPLSLRANGQRRLVISSNGNVGISTMNPAATLDVNGDIAMTVNKKFYHAGAGLPTYYWGYNQSISGTNLVQEGSSSMFWRYDGKVGIGTTNPGAKFEVEGGSMTIRGSDSNPAIAGFADAGGNYRLLISTNGNVGIGTTGPVSKLQVGARLTADSFAGFSNIGDNIYFDGTNYRYLTTAAGSISQSNGDVLWYTAPSGTAGAIATLTERMRILNSNGNVGIGNTTPSNILSVGTDFGYPFTGKVLTVGNSAGISQLLLGTDINNWFDMYWDNTNNIARFATKAAGTQYSDTLVLKNGNVGIGTTGPLSKFSVQATAVNAATTTVARFINPGAGINTGATIELGYNDTSAHTAGISGFYDGTGLALGFYTNPVAASGSLAERLRITGSGNVGIGTTTPTGLFQVGGGSLTVLSSGNVGIGTTNPQKGLDIENTVNGLPPTSGSAVVGGVRISNSGNIAMDFGTVNSASPYPGWIQVHDANNWASNFPLLLNPNGGNVGIGTTDPITPLQINGSGASGVEYVLNVIGGLAGAWTDGAAIKIGPSPSYQYGSRIVSYSNSPASYGSRLQLQTHDTSVTPQSFNTGLLINESGNVGIGTTSPGYKLTVDGPAADWSVVVNPPGTQAYGLLSYGTTWAGYFGGPGYITAAAWTYGSDRRMKENISYFHNGLDKIMRLEPARFDYIKGQKEQLGFIAQDVQSVIPEAVTVTDEKTGMLGLKTNFIIPYMVNAIKEQHKLLETQQQKIEELESKLTKLEKKTK